MPDASPDQFPETFQDFQSHERVTPRSMGGASPVLPPSMLPRRPYRGWDAKEAGAQRDYDGRLTSVIQLQGSGISAGPTIPLVITLDGPPQGKIWELRALNVGPEDLTALPWATGLTTLLFARGGTLQGGAGAPGSDTTAINLVSATQAWPAQATFGNHQASFLFPYILQVVVIGAALNYVVTVGGQCTETDVGVHELRSQG